MKRDFDERKANVSLACQTNRMILKCQKYDSAYHISCQMKSINYEFGNRLTNRLGTTAMIKRAPGLNQQNADTHIVRAVPRGRKSIFNSRGRHPDEMVNFTARLYAHSPLCRWSLESKIEPGFRQTAYRVTQLGICHLTRC